MSALSAVAYQRSCISTRAANRFKSFSSVLASSCARILCVFAEAVILMRRRSRSMQQRLVSSLVSAARCHVYTCHILPCGTHVIFCHAIVRQRQRSLRGAFLVHLPSAPRVTRDTHPRPSRNKLSVMSLALVIARACCLAARPPITPVTRVGCTSSS